MTWSFTTNQSPATGPAAVITVVNRLVTAGWTKVRDSDGTTYSSIGAQVVSGASGAGGLGNNNAFVNLRSPTGTREIVIQRGSSDTLWRITASPTAFNSGSPSATVVPSSANSGLLFGGGTDGTPTFSGWLTTNGTYRLQVGADNAAPYGFFFFTYTIGGGNPNGGLVLDPLTGVPAEDGDPVVWHVGVTGSSAFLNGSVSSTTTSTTSSRCCGWIAYGLGGSFLTIPGATQQAGGTTVVPNGLPSNPHNAKDDGVAIMFARGSSLASPNGYKGASTVMKWNGSSRSTPNTFASKSRIVAGDVSLPWDGSTDPIA